MKFFIKLLGFLSVFCIIGCVPEPDISIKTKILSNDINADCIKENLNKALVIDKIDFHKSDKLTFSFDTEFGGYILIFYKTKNGQDMFSLDVWIRRGTLKRDISVQEKLLENLVIAIKSQCIKQRS